MRVIIVILTTSLRHPEEGFSLSRLHAKCIRNNLKRGLKHYALPTANGKTKVRCINILGRRARGHNKSARERERDCVRLLTLSLTRAQEQIYTRHLSYAYSRTRTPALSPLRPGTLRRVRRLGKSETLSFYPLGALW